VLNKAKQFFMEKNVEFYAEFKFMKKLQKSNCKKFINKKVKKKAQSFSTFTNVR
jgi:hypothetical protein